jgi:hypothetical protein
MRALFFAVSLGLLFVDAAQADYSAAPLTSPVGLGEPAANASPPPHWVPKQTGHYDSSDWRRVIDSTWGPGLSIPEKLAIFDSFWGTIDADFACFNNFTVNWDSLRTACRREIQDTVSRGRFAAMMNHLAMDLRDGHTYIIDAGVYSTALLPGVPLWVVAAWLDVGHFGAGLTPLPDSSLLVYRVAENHPLGLEPGDVVLGYDHRRWIDIVRELEAAQLPIYRTWCYGSCSSAWTYSLLNGAGMNWHLFDTIDVVKYATGDTVHLPTSLLVGDSMHLFATDQMDIPGVPMPATDTTLSFSYGIVNGTHIGYIYGWRWYANASAEFYNAVYALVSDPTLKGIIIDFRYNEGGNMILSNSGLALLFRDSTKTVCFSHRNEAANHFSMKVVYPASFYVIPGNGVGYDKPIAVLVGPGAVSSGDQVAYRTIFHPRVKTFGKSTNAAFNGPTTLSMPSGWFARYGEGEACLASDTTYFLTHREFPVDVPVWHTRDAVANGRDAVVEAAIAWIDSTAGVSENREPPVACHSALSATFINGVLVLEPANGAGRPATGALLDISGRKVMDLQAGANDVRALAPGVYFCRLMGDTASCERPPVVSKVVVAR